VCKKAVPTSVFFCRFFCEERVRTCGYGSFLKLFEIVLMHAHPVELKSESTTKLCGNIGVYGERSLANGFECFCNQLYVLHIPLVKREMHLDLLFRQTLQGRKIERFRLIGHRQTLSRWAKRMR